MQVRQDVVQTIKHNKLRWYGHVHKMKVGHLPKIILEWSPEGRQKRGRPRMTWTNSVEGLEIK